MSMPLILHFDHPHADAASARAQVGGKGAGLWRMTALGLPVPPGFTVPVSVAARVAAGDAPPDGAFDVAVDAALARLEAATGRRLGDPHDPLLVSVRSGAAESMPGMMDTVLNLGATPAWAAGGPFAQDCLARFERQFAALVSPPLLAAPPRAQLDAAIRAVASSWGSARARAYRDRCQISHDGGTSVTVQAMVFGNRDDASATGVAFSRCPTTGVAGAVGDLLWQAQGEELVAGLRTPEPLERLGDRLPEVAASLAQMIATLEAEWRDLVDVEFTIESGRLWILQARSGKRSASAAARIAVELTRDPAVRLTHDEALTLVGDRIDAVPMLTRGPDAAALATGIAAAPGLATGALVVSPDAALDGADRGEAVILVRAETSPEDVHGMAVAAGILTAVGGAMSHAALVAREFGLPAVVGCAAVRLGDGGAWIGGRWCPEGTTISLDGATGEIFWGTIAGEVVADPFACELRRWAEDAKEQQETRS